MSNWPEPTRDESEPPRWGWAVAFATVAAFGVWMFLQADGVDFLKDSRGAPEFALRGRDEPAPTPAPQVSGDASPDLFATDVDGVITRPVAFKDCLALIFDTGNAVGAQPVLVEERADRIVARLPLQDSGVTITCSDGTMTIDSGAAQR